MYRLIPHNNWIARLVFQMVLAAELFPLSPHSSFPYLPVQMKACTVVTVEAYLQLCDKSLPDFSNNNSVWQGKTRNSFLVREAGIVCWLERRTPDRKAASSNPGRSGGRNFFSKVNFRSWRTIQQRSSFSLFCRRPFWASATIFSTMMTKLSLFWFEFYDHRPLFHKQWW